MKTIVLVFLFSLSVSMVCGIVKNKNKKNPKIKCDDQSQANADNCADKLWFVGKNSRKYPESGPQMLKHCKQTLNLIKCVKDFTDQCGQGVQKQLANVMLYTVKMNQKSYCTKSSKREEVISFSSCGNSIREATNKCMESFLNGLGKANSAESKYKVPQACCAFHELKSCIMKSARDKGTAVCGDRPLDNFEKYINAMAGNTLNLMCTDYEEDSDKCSQLPPLPKNATFVKPPTIIVGFGQLLEKL